MTVTRGFCLNKDIAAALRDCGLADKFIYQDGRGAEDLERCLASFRGRSGKLLIGPDLRVFGDTKKTVATVMDRLERANIRVVDVIHPQDETISAMTQRSSVAISGTRLQDRRTARKRGRSGGLGKGVAAQGARDGAVPAEFVLRVVRHCEVSWRVKLEILGDKFTATTLRRRYGGMGR